MTLPSIRLQELGLHLPTVPTPVASYVPATRVGNLIFASGQIDLDGPTGRVPEHVSPEQAADAAGNAVLNCVAAISELVGGIDHIRRIVKLTGYVASAPDFDRQPHVIEGASALLVQIFGPRGIHARAAIGVAALPAHACVEVELIADVGLAADTCVE